jgi:two-component system NtrC family sensor kinase
VRPGLRLRLLLLLGGLLLVAFVPLYFAVATYTRVAQQQLHEGHARALARAVTGHVLDAQRQRNGADLLPLLRAEVGSEGLAGLAAYDRDGVELARAVEPGYEPFLPARAAGERPRTHHVKRGELRAVRVVVPHEAGTVIALVATDDDATRVAPLLRLVGLYTAVVAVSLLGLTYYALTRLIVKPLDELARSAERVAGGARKLVVPATSVRELSELGGSLRTMTERLLAEEEALRRKIDEVEKATARLAEAQDRLVRSERLASVGRLAAGLAHEIGNPIAALIGLQDLLLAGGLNEAEQRDFLKRMRKESERINKILRDLLAFARPGSSAASAEGSPGDVAEVVHDVAALVSPQKALKGVTLELDVPQDLPPVAMSRDHLAQVLLNLVLNAADAVGPGGRVRVEAERSERGVTLAVEDNGPGVDPAIVTRLFEPFATTKEVGKGTGLGLAVCRGLVEAVGGTIALDVEHRPGARFVVDLPKSP